MIGIEIEIMQCVFWLKPHSNGKYYEYDKRDGSGKETGKKVTVKPKKNLKVIVWQGVFDLVLDTATDKYWGVKKWPTVPYGGCFVPEICTKPKELGSKKHINFYGVLERAKYLVGYLNYKTQKDISSVTVPDIVKVMRKKYKKDKISYNPKAEQWRIGKSSRNRLDLQVTLGWDLSKFHNLLQILTEQSIPLRAPKEIYRNALIASRICERHLKGEMFKFKGKFAEKDKETFRSSILKLSGLCSLMNVILLSEYEYKITPKKTVDLAGSAKSVYTLLLRTPLSDIYQGCFSDEEREMIEKDIFNCRKHFEEYSRYVVKHRSKKNESNEWKNERKGERYLFAQLPLGKQWGWSDTVKKKVYKVYRCCLINASLGKDCHLKAPIDLVKYTDEFTKLPPESVGPIGSERGPVLEIRKNKQHSNMDSLVKDISVFYNALVVANAEEKPQPLMISHCDAPSPYSFAANQYHAMPERRWDINESIVRSSKKKNKKKRKDINLFKPSTWFSSVAETNEI